MKVSVIGIQRQREMGPSKAGQNQVWLFPVQERSLDLSAMEQMFTENFQHLITSM